MQFVFRPPPPGAVSLPNLQGPADCPIFDERTRLHVGSEKHISLANQQLYAGVLHLPHRIHPLSHAAAKRLLAVDMFTRLRSLPSHRRVQKSRRRDVDDLYVSVFQQLRVRCIYALDAVLLAECSGPLAVSVTDRQNPCLRMAQVSTYMGSRRQPQPCNPNVYCVNQYPHSREQESAVAEDEVVLS